MTRKLYNPNPVDTSDVVLDESLIDLLEKLSQNTHDIWSQGRLNDGWSHGDQRDDSLKLHPCLVSYQELSEEEKQYDRRTALETLKLIIKLGYSIQAPVSLLSQSQFTSDNSEIVQSILNNKLRLYELVAIWKNHNPTLWKITPTIYFQLGLEFLKYGEALLAYDVLSEGLSCFPVPDVLIDEDKDLFIKMSQQQALALTETGAIAEAESVLKMLSEYSDTINSETYGLLGRIYKEMGLSDEANEFSRAEYLSKSYDYYYTAFSNANNDKQLDNAYYNGINAATVSLFKGDHSQSQSIAQQVADICRIVIKKCQDNADEIMYWVYATLGEAQLLSRNIDAAKKQYFLAMRSIGSDMRGQISMHKQASRILEYLNIRDNTFHDVFQPPTILVFAGHMLDLPDSSIERFSASSEQTVRKAIQVQLAEYHRVLAYSSAACGADIIFLEEVLEQGGEINIVLPFDIASFKQQSVDLVPDSGWGRRFDDVIKRAARVINLAQYTPGMASLTYDFTNRIIYGVAIARSKIINCRLECLAVWDGEDSDEIGGTHSAIKIWSKRHNLVNYIDPKKGRKHSVSIERDSSDTIRERMFEINASSVKYYNYLPLLFADVKGYSKLNERQLVKFSTVFLKIVGDIFVKHADGILNKRTQGDGMFVVFSSLQAAANFASDVNRLVSEIQWQEHGLPEDLTIRISLDAGPCYSYIEPITGNLEFCGDYVNRAARMEPITPPGHIYASETFVALAHAEAMEQYQFVYAGQVVLPKGHGIIPAYHLYRK